MKFNFKI